MYFSLLPLLLLSHHLILPITVNSPIRLSCRCRSIIHDTLRFPFRIITPTQVEKKKVPHPGCVISPGFSPTPASCQAPQNCHRSVTRTPTCSLSPRTHTQPLHCTTFALPRSVPSHGHKPERRPQKKGKKKKKGEKRLNTIYESWSRRYIPLHCVSFFRLLRQLPRA